MTTGNGSKPPLPRCLVPTQGGPCPKEVGHDGGHGEPTAREIGNANLRAPWKPGESGNPAGRSKRPSFETLVGAILDERVDRTDLESPTKRDVLARVFVDELLKRRTVLIREYLAREWPVRHQIDALVGVMDSDEVRDALRRKLGQAALGDGANGVDREPDG